MGVMTCSRRGCESIMCQTYIYQIGYICYDCQEQFKEYVQSEKLDVTTEGQILFYLEKFMKTDKDNYAKQNNEISIDEFFSNYTR